MMRSQTHDESGSVTTVNRQKALLTVFLFHLRQIQDIQLQCGCSVACDVDKIPATIDHCATSWQYPCHLLSHDRKTISRTIAMKRKENRI